MCICNVCLSIYLSIYTSARRLAAGYAQTPSVRFRWYGSVRSPPAQGRVARGRAGALGRTALICDSSTVSTDLRAQREALRASGAREGGSGRAYPLPSGTALCANEAVQAGATVCRGRRQVCGGLVAGRGAAALGERQYSAQPFVCVRLFSFFGFCWLLGRRSVCSVRWRTQRFVCLFVRSFVSFWRVAGLFVCLFACLFVCLFACLYWFVCVFVCLFACLRTAGTAAPAAACPTRGLSSRPRAARSPRPAA